MDAKNAKQTRLFDLNHLDHPQASQKLGIPLMILDIKPISSGKTDCLIMLANGCQVAQNQEKTITKSWMQSDNMKFLFTKSVNKSLVDEYEKSILKSIQGHSKNDVSCIQIRLDTNFSLRQYEQKFAQDRLNWINFLRIQLGVCIGRRVSSKNRLICESRDKIQLQKSDRHKKEIFSAPIDPKNADSLNAPISDKDLLLISHKSDHEDGVAREKWDQNKHNRWKIIKLEQEKIQGQRKIERKARHAARWELDDPKIFDCKVDRRIRAITRNSSKNAKLLKRNVCKRVSTIKSFQIQFTERKAEITSDFSKHLKSCCSNAMGPKKLVKSQAISEFVTRFIKSLDQS